MYVSTTKHTNARLCSSVFLLFLLIWAPSNARAQFEATLLVSSGVTLYDQVNMKGASKSFNVGEHRLYGPTDFNDAASSIRVPAGFYVVLYEHADEFGGYGISIDLMEDQVELAKFRFDKKASYISVQKLPARAGFVFVRGTYANGQYVAAHWERARSGGSSNGTPVVSPPIPSKAPKAQTSIQVSEGRSVISSLGPQSSEDATLWDIAFLERSGVIGSDYRGREYIGSAAFERKSYNPAIPDSFNFWFPQKRPSERQENAYFKRTLTGTVDADEEPYVVDIDGTFRDQDMTLHIRPQAKDMYMINEGHAPEVGTLQALQILAQERKNPRRNCNEPFSLVEAEIDTGYPGKGKLLELISRRIGKRVSVYGPWIYDIGHCHQPEIHPAEQIWWSEDEGTNRRYHLNIFCDSSGRFWWRHQMDNGSKTKPWGAPPIKGTFAIAFEAKIDPAAVTALNSSTQKFEVSLISNWNVEDIAGGDRIHNLIYQNHTLISFVPGTGAFRVSYERVGLKPGTTDTVRGFLVIETSVGKVTQIATRVDGINIPTGTDPNNARVPEDVEDRAFKKEDGHYMFSILRSSTQSPGVIRPPVVRRPNE